MLSFRARYNINKKFAKLSGVKRALLVNALEIQSLARQAVNVDTARLQSSIDVEVGNKGASVRIGSNVDYAAPQESIKSYLESSLEKQEPILLRDIKKAISKSE